MTVHSIWFFHITFKRFSWYKVSKLNSFETPNILSDGNQLSLADLINSETKRISTNERKVLLTFNWNVD